MVSLPRSTKSSQRFGGSTNRLESWRSELQLPEPVAQGCSRLHGRCSVRQGGLQPALCRWPGQLALLCPDFGRCGGAARSRQCVVLLGLCVQPSARGGVQSCWLPDAPVLSQGLSTAVQMGSFVFNKQPVCEEPLTAAGEPVASSLLWTPHVGACYGQEQGAPGALRRGGPRRAAQGLLARPSSPVPVRLGGRRRGSPAALRARSAGDGDGERFASRTAAGAAG